MEISSLDGLNASACREQLGSNQDASDSQTVRAPKLVDELVTRLRESQNRIASESTVYSDFQDWVLEEYLKWILHPPRLFNLKSQFESTAYLLTSKKSSKPASLAYIYCFYAKITKDTPLQRSQMVQIEGYRNQRNKKPPFISYNDPANGILCSACWQLDDDDDTDDVEEHSKQNHAANDSSVPCAKCGCAMNITHWQFFCTDFGLHPAYINKAEMYAVFNNCKSHTIRYSQFILCLVRVALIIFGKSPRCQDVKYYRDADKVRGLIELLKLNKLEDIRTKLRHLSKLGQYRDKNQIAGYRAAHISSSVSASYSSTGPLNSHQNSMSRVYSCQLFHPNTEIPLKDTNLHEFKRAKGPGHALFDCWKESCQPPVKMNTDKENEYAKILNQFTYLKIQDSFICYDGPFLDLGHVQVREARKQCLSTENHSLSKLSSSPSLLSSSSASSIVKVERSSYYVKASASKSTNDSTHVSSNAGDDTSHMDPEEEYGHWEWQPPVADSSNEVNEMEEDMKRYQFQILITNSRYSMIDIDVHVNNLPFLHVKYR
jgi:hypothetical protein